MKIYSAGHAKRQALARWADAHALYRLGKVNYCVSALIEKGWVKAHNFRNSNNKPAMLAQRARIVLDCVSLASNPAVAERFETTNATLGKWRGCFVIRQISTTC